MKARRPDSAEVRRHRRAMTPTFTGRFNPVTGVSDAVLLSNAQSAKAARQTERQWKRSLSKGQRRKLRAA